MSDTVSKLLDLLPLEQVLRTIPSGLFLVDRAQHIVYWNAEAERITGYPAAEAVGRHCSFLEGIECGTRCALYDDAVPKPVIGANCTIRRKDGSPAFITKNVDSLRDAHGTVVGGIESFIDISRRKQLEERLREHLLRMEEKVARRTAQLEAERTRLRTVLDTMSDLAYITSPGYRIEFMNRAMIETFGDQTGGRCFELYGETGVCPWCPLPQVLLNETVREERQLQANGRTYEIIHTPLAGANGSVHKLAVFRDITERKEAEEKLREANRDLDAFAYTVSHDLRTPLTPILGYAEFLRDEYREQLDERALDVLQEIEKQGAKMLRMMEDLLVLARAGKVERPEAPAETGRIVAETLKELHEAGVGEGCTVEVEPLPGVSVPDSLLGQLFANLLGNALRYAGAPDAPVTVGGSRSGERVRFFVRDHGPGIPEEEREQVFELFYRGAATRSVEGSGLGLAIVGKIARLYGGRVWVTETTGGGSTFWVEFPAGGC